MEDKSPLWSRLAMESSAAVISALCVAPAISIVDKAIVSNVSGVEPLVPCMINGIKSLVFNPLYFFRQPSFLFIWGVYGGTYIIANSIEAVCERRASSPLYPKFFGSSCANITLSVLKDKAFARMFGKGDPRPLPTKSFFLFGVRDSMTILASFTLPPIIAKSMSQSLHWEYSQAENVAQLLTPVTMQLLSTPLHIHGLDLYNRAEASSADRIDCVKREYVKTALARMARIFPAFGIGGVVNKYIRKSGKEWLQTQF